MFGKPYKRRLYDPERHCGAPIDRSTERYVGTRDRNQAKIDELLQSEKKRKLTPAEKSKLKRLCSRVALAKASLANLELHGPDDRPCVRTRGYKTSHPGTGRCCAHCECKGRMDFHLSDPFQYSRRAVDTKLRSVMDRLEAANTDLLDLSPELLLLKAKIQIFVDEKKDLEPETIKSLGILMEAVRKNVETVNNKRFQTMLSIETFNYIVMRMGEVVTNYVTDQETLDKIVAAWDRIKVDTSSKRGSQALQQISGG